MTRPTGKEAATMHQNLPQRLFLLCYTVDKGKFELYNLQGRGALLRAAALTELVLAGKVGAERGKALRLPTEPPEDPFHAGVWNDVPADKPKRWLPLVHNRAHTAEKPVRGQLAAAGAIEVRSQKWMKMVGVDRVTVNDPQQVLSMQKSLRNAVFEGADPALLPVDELVMAVLAAEAEVTSVFTGKERGAHKETFKAFAAQFDTIAPGLRTALRDSYLSSRAVGGGWGT